MKLVLRVDKLEAAVIQHLNESSGIQTKLKDVADDVKGMKNAAWGLVTVVGGGVLVDLIIRSLHR